MSRHGQLGKGHRSPKRWRVVSNRVYDSSEILKRRYPSSRRVPWWAELAKKRGWITFEQWMNVPTEPNPSGGILRLMYENNPFVTSLLKGFT